uniref:Xylulose kinase n=1 Tax=Cyprinus carpio TaxID=7962 RepID=A0A8C1W885_CYPCA
MAGGADSCFLGFDFSTQQLKVIAVDGNLEVIVQSSVQFDSELPEFRTRGGVHIHDDKLTVTSPALMFVKALDVLLEKMRNAGFDFSRVKAISGSGQQHGSVFWRKGARQTLNHLDPQKHLHLQLQECFALQDCPVWMDSSTSDQCQFLEAAVGGAQRLADITGSRAYETNIKQVQKMTILSVPEVFIRRWSQVCLDAAAPQLAERLGDLMPSAAVLGCVSLYYTERFGFAPSCKVVAFTGDNPGSLADKTSLLNCYSCNSKCQSLSVCLVSRSFKNGSFPRERIRDECAGGSWERFSGALRSTPMGNHGNLGMYFDVMEITPPAAGVHRFNAEGQRVSWFEQDVEIRALLEGQFLAKRVHAEKLGYKILAGTRVLATGGASSNKDILQVLSDVFNAPVYTIDVTDSACLGCAYRALHALEAGTGASFTEMLRNAPEPQLAARPTPGAQEVQTHTHFRVLS